MENRAGFGIRLGAFVLDYVFYYALSNFILLFFTFLTGLILNILEVNDDLGFPLFTIVIVFLYISLFWIYHIMIPVKMNGQSFGKKICGIRIQQQSKENVTYLDLFFREFIGKFISGIILLIGYIMALGDQRLALHDKIAKSEVVKMN